MKRLLRSPGGLNYQVRGTSDLPGLVLLHGFLGSRREWEDIESELAGHFRMISIDLPGHGQSVGLPLTNYAMTSVTREIGQIMSDNSNRPCNVLGYSMGGRVGLAVALRYPAQVRTLTVISSSPGIEHREDRETRLISDCTLAMRLEEIRMDDFLKEWYSQPLFQSLLKDEKLRDEIMGTRGVNDPKELAKALTGLSVGAQPSYWDDLGRLPMPVLVVAGARDSKYVDISKRMAERLPAGHRCVIRNAGHMVYREAPEEFLAEVQQFLVQEGI